MTHLNYDIFHVAGYVLHITDHSSHIAHCMPHITYNARPITDKTINIGTIVTSDINAAYIPRCRNVPIMDIQVNIHVKHKCDALLFNKIIQVKLINEKLTVFLMMKWA